MKEVILLFDWHSFCISINIDQRRATLVHNGHIQAIQLFKELEDEPQILTAGHLGGAKFVGTVTEFEMFGRPLSVEQQLQWTICQLKVKYDCLLQMKLQKKNFFKSI